MLNEIKVFVALLNKRISTYEETASSIVDAVRDDYKYGNDCFSKDDNEIAALNHILLEDGYGFLRIVELHACYFELHTFVTRFMMIISFWQDSLRNEEYRKNILYHKTYDIESFYYYWANNRQIKKIEIKELDELWPNYKAFCTMIDKLKTMRDPNASYNKENLLNHLKCVENVLTYMVSL